MEVGDLVKICAAHIATLAVHPTHGQVDLVVKIGYNFAFVQFSNNIRHIRPKHLEIVNAAG